MPQQVEDYKISLKQVEVRMSLNKVKVNGSTTICTPKTHQISPISSPNYTNLLQSGTIFNSAPSIPKPSSTNFKQFSGAKFQKKKSNPNLQYDGYDTIGQ